MGEKDYIQLTGNFYFDPARKQILKKQGGQYVFAGHDRRKFNRTVAKDRRGRSTAPSINLKPIMDGLFWDEKNQNVYRKMGNNLVLYSQNRRKSAGKSPTGAERRRSG